MNPSRPTPASTSSPHLPQLWNTSQIQWSRVAKFAVPLLLFVVAGIFLYAVRWARSVSQSTAEVREHLNLKELQERLIQSVPPYPAQSFSFDEMRARNEAAETAFAQSLRRFMDSEVRYVDAEGLSLENNRMEHLVRESQTKILDPQVFCWHPTQGAAEEIIAASHNPDEIHLFCVASQYNATEATEPRTPKPGFAMNDSANDNTQGPACQRTNPRLFELVNAYLANGGFNMLAKVLTETSMKAFRHGYLLGIDAKTESNVAKDFQDFWSRLVQVCVSSYPEGGGLNPIYLMMAAAPCYDKTYSKIFDQDNAKKIQFYAALANFTAQLKQVWHLAQQNPEKKVVYHAAAVGLGAFQNDPQVVGDAFRVAAFHFQKVLPKNVLVRFDVYDGYGAPEEKALACVQHIGLEKKSS